MILDTLFQPRASGTANPAEWFKHLLGGTESDSGIPVNSESVYKSGPFYQAVSIISGDVAQLPLRVMTRDKTGDTQRDHEHPAHRLLSHRANDEMLSHTVIELLQTWALTWGNGVAAIMREGSRPVELIPLLPDRTGIERADDKKLWYWTRIEDRGEKVMIRPENVLHIQSLSGNGLWGRSVIDLARNTVGLLQALETHGGRVFKNGAVPGGIIKRAGGKDSGLKNLGPDAQTNLLREWNQIFGGVDNTRKIAILQEGMEFQALSISNIDAQWLDAMDRSREWMAAWFKIPPHKLGSMRDSSVRANLEQQNSDYLNGTLLGWLTKWEQECFAKLLTDKQQRSESHFFKFNTAALLRADLKTRFEAYSIARTAGFMSANEIRLKEDMNRRTDEGGDSYDNPNTSSPSPQPAEPPNENKPDAPSASASHRALVLGRAEQLITSECHRVCKAARHGGNVLAWADKFYDNYGDLVETCMLPSINAALSANVITGTLHVDQAFEAHKCVSRSQLIELTGVCTADTLAAEVEMLTASWPARAETLVDNLLPAQREGKQNEAA